MDKKISVLMATFNSERTVELALQAIRKQDYPQDLIEILMVDGGSTDRTREIGRKYGCRIVENPRVEPISAKLIGMYEAAGDYLLTCDSDEVTVSAQAIRKRRAALNEDGVHLVFPSGYENPERAPFLSCYINEFGDPFSMFYYRLSKHWRLFSKQMRRMAKVIKETEDYTVFEVLPGARQPIMENGAMGSFMDLRFLRQWDFKDNPHGAVHLFFYHMQSQTLRFALTKEDALIHYSTDEWRPFLRKIHWRVVNNIFYAQNMGSAGFSGREQYDSPKTRLRKYLFLVYALTLIPALLDAVFMAATRRKLSYLAVWPLVIYTAALITFYGLRKVLGLRPPAIHGYGNTQSAQGEMPDAPKRVS